MSLLRNISTYRNELMGYSILWIMMLHFTFTQSKPLGFIAQYGFAGVDIFMLASGFGLFFSLDKNPSLLQFYKKRLLRIFPTYFLLGIISSLLYYHDSLWQYLFRYTSIGFWTNGIYAEWFIPSILVLYAVAPLIKRIFDRRLFMLTATLAVACLFLSWVLAIHSTTIDQAQFFLLYRIPAFIFGMACAWWLKHKTSPRWFWTILVCGIPCFALLFPHHHEVYNYKYLSLMFLLPSFTVCFLLLSARLKFLNPLISLMGRASLEIYLIQWLILMFKSEVPAPWHDVQTVVLIAASTLLGIGTHWLIDKIGRNWGRFR